jgi:hypothetical protein
MMSTPDAAPIPGPAGPRLYQHRPKVERVHLDGDYLGLTVEFLGDPSAGLLDQIFGRTNGLPDPDRPPLSLADALARVMLGWNFENPAAPGTPLAITPETLQREPVSLRLLTELWRRWNAIDFLPPKAEPPSETGSSDATSTPPPSPASLDGPSLPAPPAPSTASVTP